MGTTDLRANGPANFMMVTNVGGHVLEGQPLRWNKEQMFLLGRDGQLHTFAPNLAKSSRKTGKAFKGYSVFEMRGRLRGEFDPSFEISNTSHFVVVHPQGEWSAWAKRLESLYRSFVHYMQVRGLKVRAPEVPLVAVVFRNEADYRQHAAAGGVTLQPGILGHYDPISNRIFLFDASPQGSGDWSVNASTIIHEATHQTAYNVGVHHRFADQPRWLVEGLAMMFEARGLWEGRASTTRGERTNRGRLQEFRRHLPNRDSNNLMRLIAEDRMFESDISTAYAESWTLSFFLCETRPRAYCEYLQHVGSRPSFSAYPPQARIDDFTAYFGKNLEQLSAEMVRFVSDLK